MEAYFLIDVNFDGSQQRYKGDEMKNQTATVTVVVTGCARGKVRQCDCGAAATTRYAGGWSCQPCADMCARVSKELDNLNRSQNPAGERRRREEVWVPEEMGCYFA